MIYLTKNQLEEIAQQLAAISVKDSDFDLTDYINDDDFVAIVQNGINKRILIETLREGISRGEKGDPGTGIDSVAISSDGYLTFTFTDGTSWTSSIPINGKSAYELAVEEGYSGTLDQWLDSLKGEDGAPGAPGANGVGVPTGGSTGQVLAKSSGSDYATEWVNQSGGGGTQVQSDWNQTNTSAVDFIKNKPTIPNAINSLDDIPGVSISSPSNNQVLLYNGTNWVNATSPGGGGTMNYQKVTSEEYEEMLENDQLLDTVLYIIVDPAATD